MWRVSPCDEEDVYSQGHLRELLFSEVQRVVKSLDGEFAGVQPGGQTGTQNTVVHHVEERSDTVPAFVIEPNLQVKPRRISLHKTSSGHSYD